MPARHVAVFALIVALTSVAAAGCASEEPEVSASPSRSLAPVFTSEEEALAEVNATYTDYLATSDLITSEAGSDPNRIDPYVTSNYRDSEVEGYKIFSTRNVHTVGLSTFDSVRFQRFSTNLNAGDLITVYLCSDVTAVRLIDASGNDVTPADRQNRLPLEVDFAVTLTDSASLQINRSDVWSGQDFC